MKFGDIYLVDFEPSVGKEYKKTRPAIIIQMEEIFKSSPLVTFMPISSKVERFSMHDIFVEKDLKNKLTKDSIIKVNQISSFDKSRIIKKVGEANSPVIRRVRGYLRRHFGL